MCFFFLLGLPSNWSEKKCWLFQTLVYFEALSNKQTKKEEEERLYLNNGTLCLITFTSSLDYRVRRNLQRFLVTWIRFVMCTESTMGENSRLVRYWPVRRHWSPFTNVRYSEILKLKQWNYANSGLDEKAFPFSSLSCNKLYYWTGVCL